MVNNFTSRSITQQWKLECILQYAYVCTFHYSPGRRRHVRNPGGEKSIAGGNETSNAGNVNAPMSISVAIRAAAVGIEKHLLVM